MMRLRRLIYSLWLVRALRAALELCRGVRVALSSELLGGWNQILLEAKVIIGARTRIDPGSKGVVRIGERAWLSSDIELQTDQRIDIGSGTTIQRRTTISGSVQIGRSCLFAPNVFISSATHPFRITPHLPIREQERVLRDSVGHARDIDRPICIQDDCWIGTNVVILPGITVGKGAIVGANAVVTHNVQPYSVVAGAPAKMIGERLKWTPPYQIDVEKDEDLVYILAGTLKTKNADKWRRVVVRKDQPMVAAMNPSAKTIRLECEAIGDIDVKVGSASFNLSSGVNRLLVSTTELNKDYDALIVDIHTFSSKQDAYLELTRLEVES